MISRRGAALAVALCCVLLPAPATAGAGYLMIFADQPERCEFSDPGNAVITAHVLHKLSFGESATGVRFRVESPAGATWNYFGFSTTFVPVGEANSDLSVAYGQCLDAATDIGTVWWISVVASPTCGTLAVKPAQGFQVIIATDCVFTELAIGAYGGIVNPDNSCCCSCWTAEKSTWGGVKALYR